MQISFDIPLKVKSLLRDQYLRHPNPKIQSHMIETEKQKWMTALIASGVRHLLPPVVLFCARNNKKLALRITAHRFKSLDDDNLIVSVNKFIIDSLVRAEILPDDSSAIFRVRSFSQIPCKRGQQKTILHFSPDPEDATGMRWHNFILKHERTTHV